MSESIRVNRRPLDAAVDPTLVDVIHHHETGPVHLVSFFYEGRPYQASVVQRGAEYHVVVDGESFLVSFERARIEVAATEAEDRIVRAPMDCRVIAVYRAPGDAVRKGEPLLRIESMKLESNLAARRDGRVAELGVRVGESLREGQVVATISEEDPR